jgi:hypothetical protein
MLLFEQNIFITINGESYLYSESQSTLFKTILIVNKINSKWCKLNDSYGEISF